MCQIGEGALSSGALLRQVNVSHHNNTIKVTKDERQTRATLDIKKKRPSPAGVKVSTKIYEKVCDREERRNSSGN